MNKDSLEVLYQTMSIQEVADHLDVSKNKVYYYLKKFNIPLRTREESQKLFQEKSGHPRLGKSHSQNSKDKISSSLEEFWDSEDSKNVRESLSLQRKQIWSDLTLSERQGIVDKMSRAPRAKKGEMSAICNSIFDYLVEVGEKPIYNVQITQNFTADIVVEHKKVAIKIIVVMSSARHATAHDVPESVGGYSVVPYITRGNAVSKAECKRIYKSVISIAG